MKLIITFLALGVLSSIPYASGYEDEKENLSKTSIHLSYMSPNSGRPGLIGYGLHLTQHLTPEFSLTGGLDHFTFISKTDKWMKGDFAIYAATFTAKYSPSLKNGLLPFIGIGYGYYTTSYVIAQKNSVAPNRLYMDGTVDSPVGYHLVAGIEKTMNKKIRLAVEMRYIKMSANTEYSYTENSDTEDSNKTVHVISDTQNLDTVQFHFSLVYLY